MTYTALIRVAPIQTLERRNDPRWTRRGRTLYQPDALGFLPSRPTVPLLVDHDDEREIGFVREIIRMEDTTGPWLFARAVVTDPPAWLRRGTPASLGSKILRRGTFHDDLVCSAIVDEVSLLSPGVEAAEPLAEVAVLQRVDQASPAVRPSSPGRAAGEVIYGGQRIRRPNVGQVLGVR